MVQSINRHRPPDAVQRQLDLARAIADQQTAIASGKKLHRPSDNVQDWLEVSGIARQQAGAGAWLANLGRAETRAAQAENALDAVAGGIVRGKELVIQASAGSLNEGDRAGIAAELEGILATMSTLLDLDDPYGGKLFAPVALAIPVGRVETLVAAPSRLEVLGTVADGAGGSASIIDIVQAAIAAVRSGTPGDRTQSLTALDATLDHLAGLLTGQGIARNRINGAREQYAESGSVLAERRSGLEDADIGEVITRLQTLDVSLEAAQAVHARITQRSLLDFLR